ncbi:Uncharacterised protein [Elizabethkingia miricola]|nr:hypothetical protein JI58_03685 [Marinosulfonomonas sp. PRT-SC04]CAH1143537.1 hypothetical protein EAVNVB490_01410 [Elizabethkingia anophelis]SPW34296.1 Uncharacterised protein [Elizabethkingia miricola]DAT28656.1 MAG TPA: hypothetical protein [Caudoviricetes sp.]CAI9670336.1 hypothetical protein EAVNNN508_01409 [Elizabethkingia anophelis]
MAMIPPQYPYTLEVFNKAESVYDETTGEWTVGTEEWKDWGKCRDEGNTQKKQTEDSEFYIHTSIIYLPLSCADINKGLKVRVKDADGLIKVEGMVVNFRRDFFNCRIWL